MKKYDIKISLLTLLCFLLVGCGEKYNELITGYGDLEMQLSVNPSVEGIAGAESLTLPAPIEQDFSITAYNLTTGLTKRWDNIQEFNKGHKKLAVGQYEITAQNYKTLYDQVYSFDDKVEVEIRDSELSQVAFDCTVAKVVFSATNPELEGSGLKRFDLKLKSGDDYYKIMDDNYEAMNPGKVRAEITLEDLSGRSVTFSPFSIDNAKRGCHYHIQTSYNKEEGVMSFAYDEETVADPIEMMVSKDLFTTCSPTIECTGLNESGAIEMFETGGFSQPVNAKIIAPGGLKQLLFTVVSDDYPENPFRFETDLLTYDAAKLAELGLVLNGVTIGAKEADVDFSDFLSNLPANLVSHAHRVVLQVIDNFGRMAEKPMCFDVTVKPISLTLDKPAPMEIDAKSVTLTVGYNGGKVDKYITLQHYNGKEWLPLEVEKIEKIEEDRYHFTIHLPVINTVLVIRAIFKDGIKVTEPNILRRIIPEYTVTCENENVWSSKVDLFINTENIERLLPYLSVLIRNNSNEEWRPAVIERVKEENRLTISTLIPSTPYEIWVTGDGVEGDIIKVKTEDAVDLPNGDFEEVKETINIEKINCGGKYSNQNSWMPTYNVTSYQVSEPLFWSSVNDKTCSHHAKNENTWFKVPTTEVLKSGHMSAYSIRLRNAGWDIHGVDPIRDSRTDEEYYSRNVPNIPNRSAGKLFLGSYRFNADGTEEYNEGISFSSRPTGVAGYYSYTRSIYDNNEYGYVHARVLSEENGEEIVIGEGIGLLSPSTSFTTFLVPIEYKIRNKKATRLQLMLSSSNYASYSQAEETAHILTVDYPRKGMSLGAELIIDKIRLRYE